MQRNYSLKHSLPLNTSCLGPKKLKFFPALITAAFGLIAALAWNEAIKALIAQFFKSGNELMGLFVYAIIVTVIAILITYMIARALSRYGMELNKK